MGRYRLGLFRPELLIQIFPEADQDFLTFHAAFLLATSPLAHAWEKNSRTSYLVPLGPDTGCPISMGGSMTARGRFLSLLVLLAFAAFLLWSTLSSQRVECSVTVAFGGSRNSATASAASEPDATREAQTAACGPLATGMDESIACGRIPPISRHCRSL
jgi:hypothetical protein